MHDLSETMAFSVSQDEIGKEDWPMGTIRQGIRGLAFGLKAKHRIRCDRVRGAPPLSRTPDRSVFRRP